MGVTLSSNRRRFEKSDQRTSTNNKVNQYTPISEEDARTARNLLHKFLPLELVDAVLDFAIYWPSIVSEETRPMIVTSENLDGFIYLMAPPLLVDRLGTGALVNVKMIKFSLKSRDQGWGGEPNMPGPYHGSWSWFETGIYRTSGSGFEQQNHLELAGVNPVNKKKTWRLQRNVRASSTTASHEIVWFKSGVYEGHTIVEAEEDLDTGSGSGYGFVDSLAPGDAIAIIAKAKYPGWSNHIFTAKVEVFYSL